MKVIVKGIKEVIEVINSLGLRKQKPNESYKQSVNQKGSWR